MRTLLSETIYNSDTTGTLFNFLNIPQSYTHLEILMLARSTRVVASFPQRVELEIYANSDEIDTSYKSVIHSIYDTGGIPSTVEENNGRATEANRFYISGNDADINGYGFTKLFLPFYTSDKLKIIHGENVVILQGNRTLFTRFAIRWNSINSISHIYFKDALDSINHGVVAGSRAQLIGLS